MAPRGGEVPLGPSRAWSPHPGLGVGDRPLGAKEQAKQRPFRSRSYITME